jgi:hypothetical protein
MLKLSQVMVFSPPFEGGVAGTLDYLIFTSFSSRPGWLIYSFFITFISMKNKNLFNRKGLKTFRSFLMNKATSTEAANQPPRPQTYFASSNYICTVATPPSKANLYTQVYNILIVNKLYCFVNIII